MLSSIQMTDYVKFSTYGIDATAELFRSNDLGTMYRMVALSRKVRTEGTMTLQAYQKQATTHSVCTHRPAHSIDKCRG
jgi:hypothetical protein